MYCEWCQSLDYEVRPDGMYDHYICRNVNCGHEWDRITTDYERKVYMSSKFKETVGQIVKQIRSDKHEEGSDS